jgi:hypothetical protein
MRDRHFVCNNNAGKLTAVPSVSCELARECQLPCASETGTVQTDLCIYVRVSYCVCKLFKREGQEV